MEHINNYLPKDDAEKLSWLKNFIDKVHEYANSLGFSSTDTVLIEQDIQKFRSILRIKIEYIHGQSLYGLRGPVNPSSPIASRSGDTSEVASSNVPNYILRRLAFTVKDIKSKPGYSEAIGMDFGLIRVNSSAQESPNCTNINNSIHINRRRRPRDFNF